MFGCTVRAPFDFVVVHSLGWFRRDAMHSEFYLRQLIKAGVRLVSITQDVGQDASGDFIRKMFKFSMSTKAARTLTTSIAPCSKTPARAWNGSALPKAALARQMARTYLPLRFSLLFENGAPGEIRTPDPLIRSQLLYPLSYGRTSDMWEQRSLA